MPASAAFPDNGDVLVPDMFSSILSVTPVKNPHYDKVKQEAGAWIADELRLVGQAYAGHVIRLAKSLLLKALQHRYKSYMKHYMLGVLGQVNSRKLPVKALTIDEFLIFRRGTIGVMPCTVLVEYALGIEVPETIINHTSVKTCQEVAVDLVLLDNDVLSYKKDVLEGEELSVIGILRSQGYTLQEAMNEAGNMIERCYRRWDEALEHMPSWGAELDIVVLTYLDGIRNIALGSLLWSVTSVVSLWTGRYFDKEEGDQLRKTRILRLGTGSKTSL
ncbi:(+)-eremophilene synthase [Colletotrichum trifolii]|uniref:Terpene synthase n=1 Tax=Colletotrichum trifolii TaxID=5466 RepID=A0A4R8QRZ3_COLTR|nr:(+)-eremophilene synthase [Colletotrichum trifolii]